MKRLRNNRGVTIVDAAITIFLLAVTAAIFGSAFPTGTSAIKQAGENARATAFAQQKLEELRLAGYENLNYNGLQGWNPPLIDPDPSKSLPFYFTGVNKISADTNPTTGLPNGVGEINIENEPGTTSVKRVTVTVTYTGPGGRERKVVLTTLISNKAQKVG